MNKTGKFVVFEGGEGGGKTTAARFVFETLSKKGLDVLLTYEPGGTALGNKIREILVDSSVEKMRPMSELLLFLADRAEHIEKVIKPALEAGKIVICDRFDGSTFAYQAGARTLNLETVRLLNSYAKGGIEPDLYILFNVSPEIGLKRDGKNESRFEKEAMDFHYRVSEAYLKIALENKKQWEVVDASQTSEEVGKNVLVRLEERKII